MRILIITGAALLIACAANAETGRGAATKAFVDACVAELAGDLADPAPACACGAGVVSGSMTDTEYEIMGRLSPYLGDDAGMDGAIRNMITNDGYTAEQIVATGELLGSLEGIIDGTCKILER